MLVARSARLAVLLVTLAACERDPLDVACPEVDPGGLVLSEVRGSQSTGDDAQGQWIEIYNPGAQAVSLGGLIVRLVRLDGSSEVTIVVRDSAVTIPAAGYAVLGRFNRGDEPAHVDYGYAADFAGDIYADGLLQLISCGTVIDSAGYHDLPGAGSLAVDGAAPPDADTNDTESNWCADASASGSPGEGNPTCP